MANITKSPSVNNYKNISASNVRSSQVRPIINQIYGKGETHNTPNQRSGNENIILDAFYSNSHNLKASFLRLSNKEADNDSLKQYYKTHEEEVFAGASNLIESIESILNSSASCDKSFGTHFTFLVESILNDFDVSLRKIGITHVNYNYEVNKHQFFIVLCDTPEIFEFLFLFPNGLVERLSKVYYKIQGITDTKQSEGRIIDYRT